MGNKCILCKKQTIACECDKKICVCGHSLGYHRFIKMAKPDACLFVFNEDDIKKHKYCKCNKYKEK